MSNSYKNLSEEEWKRKLDPEEYNILREKGNERPFTGKYYLEQRDGIYYCGGCGSKLFSSNSKYDAGCGWPSFSDVIDQDAVNFHEDRSHGMFRTEVTCKNCESHLGHIFSDGPYPTGNRYCINSAALKFVPKD